MQKTKVWQPEFCGGKLRVERAGWFGQADFSGFSSGQTTVFLEHHPANKDGLPFCVKGVRVNLGAIKLASQQSSLTLLLAKKQNTVRYRKIQ